MRRPEKKELGDSIKDMDCCFNEGWCWELGYNQACDDWEKWLPSVEEIEEIIELNYDEYNIRKLSKAIHNRLTGE